MGTKNIAEVFKNIQMELEALRCIVALMPGHVYWKNKEGVILGCNILQAKDAGLSSPEEMIGKTEYDMPWQAQADEIRKVDLEVMNSGVTHTMEESALLADGKEAVFLSQKIPMYDSQGDLTGLIGISMDITAQKAAEAWEKQALIDTAAAAQAKAEMEEEIRRAVMILSGSIAHDLRTPLACVAGLAYALKTRLPILARAYVQQVAAHPEANLEDPDLDVLLSLPEKLNAHVNNMNEFIDETLKALSKSLLGSLEKSDLVTCKSYSMVDRVLASYPFEEGEKKLVEYQRAYYFDFLGNPVLFMRVLFNLLKNSLYQIHKNCKGQISIFASDGGEVHCLHFKDTAGGAPPSVVDTIFEGYKTTKKEGTGVGLSFCKLTMQSFGGDIRCHSVEGDFIEFVMSFPKLITKAA